MCYQVANVTFHKPAKTIIDYYWLFSKKLLATTSTVATLNTSKLLLAFAVELFDRSVKVLYVSHHHITELCIVVVTGEELQTCTTGRRVKGPILLIVIGFREVCVVTEATALQLLPNEKQEQSVAYSIFTNIAL